MSRQGIPGFSCSNLWRALKLPILKAGSKAKPIYKDVEIFNRKIPDFAVAFRARKVSGAFEKRLESRVQSRVRVIRFWTIGVNMIY